MPRRSDKPAGDGPKTSASSELSALQELMLDLAADMIRTGGAPSERSNLVLALLTRYGRRTLCLSPGAAETDGDLTRFVADRLPLWLNELEYAAGRKRPVRRSRKTPNNDVATRLRANVREELTELFEGFLILAPPAELMFLRDLLVEWSVDASPNASPRAEFTLATAFMQQISEDDTFVRVPDRNVPDVEQFLKWLRSVETE